MSGPDDSDITANLTVGPTDRGMVRILVDGEDFVVPMDFEPDEADEIAEELRLAAEAARAMSRTGKPKRNA